MSRSSVAAALVALCVAVAALGPARPPGPDAAGAPVQLAAARSTTAGAVGPAAPEPTITIVDHSVAATTTPLVQLDGWPAGRVDLTVCGDDARRASTDCDTAGGVAATVPVSGTVRARLPAGTPPIGCPCVLRVSMVEQVLVRTLPLDLPGVPVLTPDQMPPDPNRRPDAGVLEATAIWTDASTWNESLVEHLGGPARRLLTVTVRNRGAAPLEGLARRVVVGPQVGTGELVALPPLATLAPGEVQTITVPVDLPALTWGTIHASGTVTGMASPVTFRADTDDVPWLVVPFVGALVVLLGATFVRRVHRRRRPGTAAEAHGERSAAPEAAGAVTGDAAGHGVTPSGAAVEDRVLDGLAVRSDGTGVDLATRAGADEPIAVGGARSGVPAPEVDAP